MKSKFLFASMLIIFGAQSWAAAVDDEFEETGAQETVAKSPEIKPLIDGHPMSIGVEPLWLLVGGLGAKADIGVTKKIAMGIQGIYIPGHKVDSESNSVSNESYVMKYEEANIGPIFMITGDLTHSGWYISPMVGYVKASIEEYGDDDLSGSVKASQFRAVAGYQWIDPYTRNMKIVAGGGIRVAESSDIVVKDSNGKEVLREKSGTMDGLALDLSIGFAF